MAQWVNALASVTCGQQCTPYVTDWVRHMHLLQEIRHLPMLWASVHLART
jgi:hypothetical protein